VSVTWDEDDRWFVLSRGQVAVACNLSPERQALPVPGNASQLLLASSSGWAFGSGRVETDGESVVVLELS
jgi:maltooligosyltrehalose trehalohydrolase